jgi:hypothetical protein
MDSLAALGLALIISWMVGVISFLVWITGKVQPDLRRMLDSEDPKEVAKATKVLYPPRFYRD